MNNANGSYTRRFPRGLPTPGLFAAPALLNLGVVRGDQENEAV